MQLESEDNILRVRVGRGAVYHEGAQFVLKILPDMDRDKVQSEQPGSASGCPTGRRVTECDGFPVAHRAPFALHR